MGLILNVLFQAMPVGMLNHSSPQSNDHFRRSAAGKQFIKKKKMYLIKHIRFSSSRRRWKKKKYDYITSTYIWYAIDATTPHLTSTDSRCTAFKTAHFSSCHVVPASHLDRSPLTSPHTASRLPNQRCKRGAIFRTHLSDMITLNVTGVLGVIL